MPTPIHRGGLKRRYGSQCRIMAVNANVLELPIKSGAMTSSLTTKTKLSTHSVFEQKSSSYTENKINNLFYVTLQVKQKVNIKSG